MQNSIPIKANNLKKKSSFQSISWLIKKGKFLMQIQGSMKINKIQNKPQRCEWYNVNNILLRGKFIKCWKGNYENSFSNMPHFRWTLITLTGKGLCSFLWLLLPVSGHVEPEPLFCEKVQLSRQSVLLGSGLQMHGYPGWKNKTKHNKSKHLAFFVQEETTPPCFSHIEVFSTLKATKTNTCPLINLLFF